MNWDGDISDSVSPSVAVPKLDHCKRGLELLTGEPEQVYDT